MVHIHCKFLRVGQWNPRGLLPKLHGFETGQSPFPLSLCDSYGGFLLGCRVKGRSEEGVQISHLLFVDDTLVFFQASQDQLTYLS